MAYITSRGFVLPRAADEMSRLWFNVWSKRLWPYEALQPGDTLWWYESPSSRLRWKTRVTEVEAFPYDALDHAMQHLEDTFNTSVDRGQDYLLGKPDQGYCLAYAVQAIRLVDVPKPKGFRFNQNGWERDTREAIASWLQGAR
jgi:hypothetical protein